jgi:hypothetical protein
MSTRNAALVVLATALTLASAAAGTSTASKQRVMITGKVGVDRFTLTPLTPGVLGTDSGSVSFCCWGYGQLVRDGQDVIVNDHELATYTGKRGTLVVRSRNEWLDAGNGYTIGVSTWRVVRGTGAYKGVTGGGRGAASWIHPTSGPVFFQDEGFLISK